MGVTDFLISIALKKGIKGAIVAVAPYLAIVLPVLAANGINVTIDQDALTVGLVASAGFAIEFIRNWMKHGGKK